MHYIKDIFENNYTQHAHDKLVRYSKGVFQGPLMRIKVLSSQIKVNASFHYIDELQRMLIPILKNQNIHVKGTLVWNSDLSKELENLGIKYSKVSKARGIFKYTLDNDIQYETFVTAMSKYHLLFSFKLDNGIAMVTKTAFPKPNKEFSDDFCKLTLPMELKDFLFKEFAFDVKDQGKEFKVTHTITIDDIVLPEKYETFEQARQEAKRVGKFERVVTIKEKEVKSQVDFNL